MSASKSADVVPAKPTFRAERGPLAPSRNPYAVSLVSQRAPVALTRSERMGPRFPKASEATPFFERLWDDARDGNDRTSLFAAR